MNNFRVLIVAVSMFVCSFSAFSQADTLVSGHPIYNLNGNIGMGTSTPLKPLHISSTTDDHQLLLEGTNGKHSWIQFHPSGSNVTNWRAGANTEGFSIYNLSQAKYRLTINDNGNIGIGTTSPASKLHISSGSAGGGSPHNYSQFTVEDNNDAMISLLTPSSSTAYMGFADTDDNYVGGMEYDHSADQIMFKVNNHSDAALTIDSNNSIGIGTTTPASKLHIKRGSAGGGTPHNYSQLTVEDNNDAMISLLTPNSSTAYMGFADSDDNYVGGMQYDHSADQIMFRVNNHSDAALTIDSNKNIGIGTTTPDYQLTVLPEARGSIGISVNDPDYVSLARAYLGVTSNGAGFLEMRNGTNNEQIMLTASGNSYINSAKVGIGTTSPDEKLEVNGNIKLSDYGYQEFRVGNTSGYVWGNHDYSGTAGSFQDDIVISANWQGVTGNTDNIKNTSAFLKNSALSVGRHGVRFFTSETSTGAPDQRMVINTDGKVGIGTTDPKYPLNVAGRINSEANGDYYGAWFGGEARTANPSINVGEWHNYRGTIYWDSADDKLVFETQRTDTYANSLVMEDGNVGVGVANPTEKLEVAGNAMIQGSSDTKLEVKTVGSGAADLTINTATNYGGISFKNNDTEYWYIGNNATGSGDITFFTGTNSRNEQLRITADGNLISQGNIEATRVKVSTTPGSWPDYVFQQNYDLKPLNEVEAYIKANKHLPEVPSAKEVEENGLDLGNMDATLLKKFEEMTLYMIEMKKEIEMLKIENKELKKAIKE